MVCIVKTNKNGVRGLQASKSPAVWPPDPNLLAEPREADKPLWLQTVDSKWEIMQGPKQWLQRMGRRGRGVCKKAFQRSWNVGESSDKILLSRGGGERKTKLWAISGHHRFYLHQRGTKKAQMVFLSPIRVYFLQIWLILFSHGKPPLPFASFSGSHTCSVDCGAPIVNGHACSLSWRRLSISSVCQTIWMKEGKDARRGTNLGQKQELLEGSGFVLKRPCINIIISTLQIVWHSNFMSVWRTYCNKWNLTLLWHIFRLHSSCSDAFIYPLDIPVASELVQWGFTCSWRSWLVSCHSPRWIAEAIPDFEIHNQS